MYYHLLHGMEPLENGAPETWEHILAVLSPEEVQTTALPFSLPEEEPHERLYCRLSVHQDQVSGFLHTPARAGRGAIRLHFVWWKSSLLIVDAGHVIEGYIQRIREMRSPCADGADGFMADLLLLLVADDLAYIQQLETRCADLEQGVLQNQTAGFIERMSIVRRELDRSNRYYAQLGDLAETLEENDLFRGHSAQRLRAFLRRVNTLREETQMLREYASQVSSEYQAQVDIAQNHIMKLLTIVTTIFLPLTLVVGWYGMNFPHMLLLEWAYGYPAIIVFCVLMVLGCIVYFKKKHFW